MLTIRKNGKVVAVAKDDRLTFKPSLESEMDKPNTLYNVRKEREGLSNDDF